MTPRPHVLSGIACRPDWDPEYRLATTSGGSVLAAPRDGKIKWASSTPRMIPTYDESRAPDHQRKVDGHDRSSSCMPARNLLFVLRVNGRRPRQTVRRPYWTPCPIPSRSAAQLNQYRVQECGRGSHTRGPIRRGPPLPCTNGGKNWEPGLQSDLNPVHSS